MTISQYRQKIDLIDVKLVSLLNDRAQLSQAIGREKFKVKKDVYAPDREKEVFERVKKLAGGVIPVGALQAIYREIMSCSLSLEKPLRIAALGQRGSFSFAAAQKVFGSQVQYVSCPNISDIFRGVEKGENDYGVVPVENSTEGAVTPTFDLMVDSELRICRQEILEISHNLLGKTPKSKIKKIYSNPQVFGQCRQWLEKKLPQASQIWVASTTEAAQLATKEKNSAALASIFAADEFKLSVIARDVQDIAHNKTRFWVMGLNDAAPTGHDRTSLLLSIKDRQGALYHILEPFDKFQINLTKIESRPSKKKAWDYYFFVDIEGHRLDSNVTNALNQVEGLCKYLKVLGSYPVFE